MEDNVIILEQEFDSSRETVWRALTDPNQMKHWYIDPEEFKTEVGCHFEFTSGPTPERQYVHLCNVIEVVPDKKLSYTWRYKGYEGNSLLTFELFNRDGKTKLILTHTGLDTLPQDNPDFAIHNFREGWNQLIRTSLTNFLADKRKQ